MPRKVDPHRFEQTEDWPTDFVETFELPDAVEELLPDALSPEQKNLALEQIRNALGEYKWEQEAGPHRYTRGEAAKGHCQRKNNYLPKRKFDIYPPLISHGFFGSDQANPHYFKYSEFSSDSARWPFLATSQQCARTR